MRKHVPAHSRKHLLAGIFMFISSLAFSQSTNISGIVNTYHKVIDLIPSKAAVRVTDVTGLGYGNLVLVIQMKGAAISTANNSTYGDTTSLNGAGTYEIATICAVIDDSVFFFHDLMNTYDMTQKVQLVKFGEYYNANVTATVKAASWDSATGLGGVLAIRTEETLTLNASMTADSAGYRGGSFLMHSGTCSNFAPATGYAYDGNTTTLNGTGAFKGEGVATFVATQDGGRGAPANGGGGGNNHNNGGGGGGHIGAGGKGGGNYTTVSGACTGAREGLGGKALSSWAGTKIFFGGGGGNGHVNNNTPTHGGGHGGGIVIILAKDIIGNGHTISANGQAGGNGASDGASGGGAGGTIIMHVLNSYSGALTIQANGGNGGSADNQNIVNRCYGAGGGGGGGAIYFNGAAPAITQTANGGAAGANLRVSGCGAPVVADAGSAGTITSSYSYRTSTAPSAYCEFLLPVKLISFNATLTPEKKVRLQWEIANPHDALSYSIERTTSLRRWESIATVTANDNIHNYMAIDHAPVNGENLYRLRIRGKDNSITYSPQKRVIWKEITSFTVYPNPAKRQITLNGTFTKDCEVMLTDIAGKILLRKKMSGALTVYTIDLPALPDGVYLLKADGYVQKLIINK